ncbi:MAG: thioredoxin domain-containing protein [Desulfomonilaceae bacterium]|nr:thioredoxin domain-containing protein [Desulfomonilaceae bacterium]
MDKMKLIVFTTAGLLLVVGLILSWAVYQQKDVAEQVGHLKSFTDENFEKEVVQASMKLPVLIDFYAEWCFPCKMLDPVLAEVAAEFKDQAVIGKLDTDKNLIARRFGVSKIPALFLIKDGEIKNAFYGVVPKETIVRALNEFGS